MFVTNKIIALLLLLFFAGHLYAGNICIPYAEGNNMIVGLYEESAYAASLAKVVFDEFIKKAKANDTKSLVKHYSKADGSDRLILSQLKENPNKYAGYSGLIKYSFNEVFRWGNYLLIQVAYQHKNGNLISTEAFYCQNNECKVSGLFEMGEERAFLISRFIYLYRGSKQQAVTCPEKKGEKFSVLPAVGDKYEYPISVYMNEDIKYEENNLVDKASIAHLPRNIRDCYKRILSMDDGVQSDQQLLEIASQVIKTCSVNMDEKKLIPITLLQDKPVTTYYTPVAYVSLIKNTVKLNQVISFKDNDVKVVVAVGERYDGAHFIVVLPIRSIDGLDYFDWGYFGGASGELLVSRFFGEYVKRGIDGILGGK